MDISVGSLEIPELGPSKCMYSGVDQALPQWAALPTKLALLPQATPYLGGPRGPHVIHRKKLPALCPIFEGDHSFSALPQLQHPATDHSVCLEASQAPRDGPPRKQGTREDLQAVLLSLPLHLHLFCLTIVSEGEAPTMPDLSGVGWGSHKGQQRAPPPKCLPKHVIGTHLERAA